jgi:hypothetical protein
MLQHEVGRAFDTAALADTCELELAAGRSRNETDQAEPRVRVLIAQVLQQVRDVCLRREDSVQSAQLGLVTCGQWAPLRLDTSIRRTDPLRRGMTRRNDAGPRRSLGIAQVRFAYCRALSGHQEGRCINTPQ